MSSRPPPSGESRFGPRDRSPSRFDRERRPSAPFDRQPRNGDTDRRDPSGLPSSTSRDAPPRGPKALESGPRGLPAGPGPAVPSGPRNRTLGDAPPLSDTRDTRTWRNDRGRDFGRDRRPSPRGRSPVRDRDIRDRDIREPRDFRGPRDGRDSRDFPRDLDIARAQRNVRDGPPSAGSTYSDPPSNSAGYGRGSYRGRGRGDWEPRGRGRGFHNDDRDHFRPRSRSRDPFPRREPLRDDRDADRRDDGRFNSRRDDERRIYRDREERDSDRYKPSTRVDSWTAGESRVGPPGSASPHVTPVSTTNVDRFGGPDSAGPRDSRRSSVAEVTTSKDIRRDSDKVDIMATRPEIARERFQSRPSSPPVQAPSVPAFGSVSLTGPRLTSNVWKAPPPETKPASSLVPAAAPMTSPVKQTAVAVAPAPEAVKAVVTMPPTGPKASRPLEVTDKSEAQEAPKEDVKKESVAPSKTTVPTPSVQSPSDVPKPPPAPGLSAVPVPAATNTVKQTPPVASAPQAASSVPAPRPITSNTPTGPMRGPRDMSPTAPIPQGPRNIAPMATSPKAASANIPTGPKAERYGPNTPRVSMYNPHDRPTPFTSPRTGPPKSLQWVRPGHQQSTPTGPSYMRPSVPAVVPAKRDATGEERERLPAARSVEPRQSPAASEIPATIKAPNSPEMKQPGSNSMPNPSRSPSMSFHAANDKSILEDKSTAQDTDVEMGEASPLVDKPALFPPSSTANDGFSDDDDPDLTEADYLAAEEKFERKKQLVKAKMIDLSDRSLRAVTPLEEIMLLNTITMDDLEYMQAQEAEKNKPKIEEPVSPKTTRPSIPPPEVLTPTEEDDDVSMQGTDDAVERASLNDADTSVEDIDLPFLKDGFPTPLSAPDFEPSPALPDDVVSSLKDIMHDRNIFARSEQTDLEDRFHANYQAWREYVDALDEQTKVHDEELREKSIEPRAAATPDPLQLQSLPVPGRAQRGQMAVNSEYEMQKVLEESRRLHEVNAAKQDHEAKSARADMEREAEIPALLTPANQERRTFADTNRLREAHQVLECWHFDPPVDDFTEEEHKTLVARYFGLEKQWGQLAKLLPGRNYKQCINHYYATKWNKEYKEKKSKKKGARSKAAKAGAARGRAPANPEALRQEIGEDGLPVVAVTDSGRPRRAAAPQFGMDQDSETPVPVPAGRARGQVGEVPIERGPKRARTTKEKAPRKTKAQAQLLAAAPTPVPATSPIKQPREKMEKPPGVKQEEVSLRSDMIDEPHAMKPMPTEFSMEGPQQPIAEEYMQHMAPPMPGHIHGVPMIPLTNIMRPRAHTASSRSGPSSYWSVQEQHDFKKNVAHFGTDFVSISEHMGTKTSVMVKNQYQRMVEGGDTELLKSAEEAERMKERGIDRGPPPISTTQSTRKRYDVPSAAMPRPLAPNPEAIDIDSVPPAALAPAQASPPLASPSRGPYLPTVSEPGTLRRPMGLPHSHASPPTMTAGVSEIQHSPPSRPPAHFQRTNLSGQQPGPLPARGTFDQAQARPGVVAQVPPNAALQPHPGPPSAGQTSQRPPPMQARPEQPRPSFLPSAGSPPVRHGAPSQTEFDRDRDVKFQTHAASPAAMQPKPPPQERAQHSFAPSRQFGPTIAPPTPPSLPRSTGPPTSAALDSRSTPIQQPLAAMSQPSAGMRHLMETPSTRSPLSQAQHVNERHPSLFPPQEPPPQPTVTPAPAPPATPAPKTEPRKTSNIFSLLSNDEPPAPKRESTAGMAGKRPAPPVSQSPAPLPVSTGPGQYMDPRIHPSYSQSTYAPPAQIPSRPPSRAMVDPTREPPPHASHSSQGWGSRPYGQSQAPAPHTNPPTPVHPSSTPNDGRTQQPFNTSHRALAFGQHTQIQANPSPPPHTAYPHSRTTSYSQPPPPGAPAPPSSQAPSRIHTPPVVGGPPVLHTNPYTRLSQSGTAPSSHIPHLQTSQAPLPERSYAHNQSLSYTAQHSAPPPRGIGSITDKLNHDPREQQIQMQRERDMQEREQREREVHLREQRDKDDRAREAQRERERYPQYSHHPPPHHETSRDRYAPQASAATHTPTPYSSFGGSSRGPPPTSSQPQDPHASLHTPGLGRDHVYARPPPQTHGYDNARAREAELYDRERHLREQPPTGQHPHGHGHPPPPSLYGGPGGYDRDRAHERDQREREQRARERELERENERAREYSQLPYGGYRPR